MMIVVLNDQSDVRWMDVRRNGDVRDIQQAQVPDRLTDCCYKDTVEVGTFQMGDPRMAPEVAVTGVWLQCCEWPVGLCTEALPVHCSHTPRGLVDKTSTTCDWQRHLLQPRPWVLILG